MASEYKLQEVNNLPTANAQSKIYGALNAINRLDSYAEPFFGCGYSGNPSCYTYSNINGFFMRDDADDYFVQYW
jgi:hypothetical protein